MAVDVTCSRLLNGEGGSELGWGCHDRLHAMHARLKLFCWLLGLPCKLCSFTAFSEADKAVFGHATGRLMPWKDAPGGICYAEAERFHKLVAIVWADSQDT